MNKNQSIELINIICEMCEIMYQQRMTSENRTRELSKKLGDLYAKVSQEVEAFHPPKGDRDRKIAIAKDMQKKGYSYRQIAKFLEYKSPRSISELLGK